MRALHAILLFAIALPAGAATLRPATTLQGPTVLLRDLFDDPGAEADRVLGRGPAPGARIVVEAPQLRAIARQFDVDWTPASSGDRIVLERPGTPMGRDEVALAIRAALVVVGASPDCAIDLFGFSPPSVPPGASPRPVVSQLNYDTRAGRFTALLSVAAEGMDPVNLRVAGQVREMVDLPVAATSLSVGRIVAADDVRMGRVGVSGLRGAAIHTAEQAIGLQLTRALQPGQPIYPDDLTRPTMVRRGTLVQIRLESGGVSITGQAVSLASGAEGDRIKVRNPGAKIDLEGIIIGPDMVRILPTPGFTGKLDRHSTGFAP